jgi:hypothetical protein
VKRLHLFEIHDQTWCPAAVRDAATDYLRLAVEVSEQTRTLTPLLRELLERTSETHIVDLCSGGGGPVPSMVAILRAEGLPVTATLTDAMPGPALAAQGDGSDGTIRYEPEPIDARAVPTHLRGLRTLFNAFHHFKPDEARAILADARREQNPICIVEFVERTPSAVLGMLFSPLAALWLMPRARPVRWRSLALTYLLPVVPFVVMFDGLVSCLRVYDERELGELTRGLDAPGWHWETRRVRLAGPLHATVLLGRPSEL